MSDWLTFMLAGLVTFLLRGSFLIFGSNREIPPVAQRMLKYVSPAVFAAIVLPAVVQDEGMSRFIAPDPRLLAIIIGGLVAWKSRNVIATLILGMVALWLLQWSGL